jgi:hypothetical protein
MIRAKRLAALITIGISLFFVISLINSGKKKIIPKSDESYIVISESLKNSSELLQKGKSIFFLETHNTTVHKLSARQACSIESAGE